MTWDDDTYFGEFYDNFEGAVAGKNQQQLGNSS